MDRGCCSPATYFNRFAPYTDMRLLSRLTLLTVLVLAFTGMGTAITSYNISIEDGQAHINASFELYTGNPGEEVTHWRTSWSPPPGSDIHHVADTQGDIDEYEYDGNTIEFETNQGPPREKEVIDIRLVTDDIVTEEYNGVNVAELQLSGFPNRRDDVPDEVTQAEVRTDEQLLSTSSSPGFTYTIDDSRAAYDGTGPLNIHLAMSDAGVEYENYVRFGDGNLSEVDDLYWLAPALTGFAPPEDRFPVVILPDAEYDRTINEWSSGQYRTGGLIFIRGDLVDDDRMPAVVMHETLHAINEPAVRWSDSRLTWFDEGTAKYLETVVNHERDITIPEIFGEEVTWQDDRYEYTLPPRGTPDQLWTYYQNGEDWMYHWSPRDSPSDEERVFGYAYSELLIRNYLEEHGFDALHPVYDDLREKERDDASTPQQETEQVLDLMDADFAPCYDEVAPSRDEFEACLDDANAFDPDVPTSVTVADTQQDIEIDPIERPDPPEHPLEGMRDNGSPDADTILYLILEGLQDIGDELTAFFTNLFKRT